MLLPESKGSEGLTNAAARSAGAVGGLRGSTVDLEPGDAGADLESRARPDSEAIMCLFQAISESSASGCTQGSVASHGHTVALARALQQQLRLASEGSQCSWLLSWCIIALYT
jgi:hypothetical protein